MGKVYFISGIDTGVGKTIVTGLMARHLLACGVDVVTVKMVQTGCDGFSEDLDEHRRICGGVQCPEDASGLTAPQIFKFPSSPELAARLEGRTVDLKRISDAVAGCAAAHDVVLVEGAGGLAVPLSEDVLSIDFAASQGWPLVLVTSGRLGSINHTILSLEAAKARGMRVAGVVHNFDPSADPVIDADAFNVERRVLARLGFPPVVIRVPRCSGAPASWPDVDFSEILKSNH